MDNNLDARRGCSDSPKNLTKRSDICSKIITDTIPFDFLQIWSQLPDQIRMDSSLDVFKEEYDHMPKNVPLEILTSGDSLDSNISSVHKQKVGNHKKENEHSDKKFNTRKSKLKCIVRCTKLTLLVTCWIAFSIMLMVTKEKKEKVHIISVPDNDIKSMLLADSASSDRISVTIEGSLLLEKNAINVSQSYLSIWLLVANDEFSSFQSAKNISEEWILPLMSSESYSTVSQRRMNTFKLKPSPEDSRDHPVVINLRSNSTLSVPLILSYDLTPLDLNKGLVSGTFILIGLYIIIMFDLMHRTIAALLAATGSLAILAALNHKPTVTQITSWVDFNTIMLLFSMMVLVAVIADTGTFDYFAVFAYKITSGKVLPLVSMLCFFTAFVSAILDNVTVIMIIIPVTIKLCEVIKINPVPVIILLVMFSNVGGAMTPIGDPPNVIIASNRRVIGAGVDFGTFTLHMGVGVLLSLVVLYGHFRFIFRNIDKLRFEKPKENQELQQEIDKWQMTATNLKDHNEGHAVARDLLLSKIREVLQQLENKIKSEKNFKTTLKELNDKYQIRDKWLLAKSGVCMILVLILFFLHSSPNFHLSIGSTAFLCVLLLLILADNKTFDDLLARVEWSTLLFFAALFVLMEALTELGLISWVGNKVESIIMSVSEESRLSVAILLLLWTSALAGALVDNVPLTTMMIKIVTSIAENSKLKLPLQPLVWALAFGACFGGNGTLIGATTNVVCAGVAEQYGYRVTFMQFFKIGFPVLLTSTLAVSAYLFIAHVIFEWNY